MADKSVTRAKLEERLWAELEGDNKHSVGKTIESKFGEIWLQTARLLHESLIISEVQEKQRKES